MAASIQAIIAGLLLVAWFWVLRRPMVEGSRRIDKGAASKVRRETVRRSAGHGAGGLQRVSYLDRTEAVAAGAPLSVASSISLSSLVPRPIVNWWHQPVARRRRQLMLATMFATFASFLMAIALRDRFVYLFILMATALIGHVLLASRLGARVVAEQRVRQVKHATAQLKSRSTSNGITIRASRVAAGHVADLGGVPLVLGGPVEPEPVKVTTLVSELIDSEWGESATEAEPTEPEPVAGTTATTIEDTIDDTAADAKSASAAEESDDAAVPSPEPIFTVAAKDVPSRSRRKARPIYIESQLDESDVFPAAKAVSHP